MGCNCKNSSVETESEKIEKTNKIKVFNIALNFIAFLIVTCIVIPLIIPFTIYVLFKTIVLRNSDMNVTSNLLKLGKKMMEKENSNKDDESYDLFENNDDYELTDVESVNKL
jgi:uncharacterized membrane protein